MREFKRLEETIGIIFRDENLLRQAVVHRSYLNENPDFGLPHNERLEFLGDAVLEIIVTEHLFKHYPDTPEGDLTNWRASLVNSRMLAQVAGEIELEEYLYLSRGESKDNNSKARQYILANAVEALIGAVYLDQGIEAAGRFVSRYMLDKLAAILKQKLYLDSKSYFQEKSQEKYKLTPHYRVLSEAGPDHAKTFEVGLYLGEDLVATGQGTSKQEAQVDAATKGVEAKGW